MRAHNRSTLATSTLLLPLAWALALAPAAARAQSSLDDLDDAKKASPPSTKTPPPGDNKGPSDSPNSLDALDQAGQGGGKPATADESPSKSPVAEVNGYFWNRFQYTLVRPDVPVPTQDLPSLHDIMEGNIQLKVRLGAPAFFYADISLFYQVGGLYYKNDGMGGRESVDNHDVPSLRPFVVPSELYLSYSPKPWLNLLVGKKRIIWGSGFAFNPTDLVNPPRDPTDPSFQRSGGWVARVELPFEKFTVSALFSPSVLYQQSGIPYAVMQYPGFNAAETPKLAPPDQDLHYLLALRLYALIYDADVNFMYFFTNRYRDQNFNVLGTACQFRDFENKSRFGVSFSRYFFTDYELHVEALLQTGSARLYPGRNAPTGDPCGLVPLAQTRKDTDDFLPRVLVGGRTQFKDESLLSIEYYYQADGYSQDQFEQVVRLQSLAASTMQTSGATAGALPTRFSFDPLRRHYLIASYTKPKIHDDWSVGVVLIASLTDLSGLISPQVSWNAREWLTLSVLGFIPIRGIPVNEIDVNGKKYGEYGMTPMDFRATFEIRAYY